MSEPKASVILATFDWPEALELVLSALLRQDEQNFEVLITDDGSDERTRAVIEKFKKLAGFRIEQFWQEHKGFRKSRILNQAIAAARGTTLIFLDGDCVPHPHFVAGHLELQEKGRYIAGRRIDLSPELTKTLNSENLREKLGVFSILKDSLREAGSKPFHRAYMVRNSFFRKIFGLEKVVDLKGCNFSVARSDMIAINGFDESYEGYGREDTDVELRLQNLGLTIKSAKNICLQFHLWHKPRGFTPANEELLAEVKRSKRVLSLHGLKESAQ